MKNKRSSITAIMVIILMLGFAGCTSTEGLNNLSSCAACFQGVNRLQAAENLKTIVNNMSEEDKRALEFWDQK